MMGCQPEYSRRSDLATQGGPFNAGDGANGQPAWLKLPPGSSIARADPGSDHCGAYRTGWLSGWAADGLPTDNHYAVSARADSPPPLGSPATRAVVCFNYGKFSGWVDGTQLRKPRRGHGATMWRL